MGCGGARLVLRVVLLALLLALVPAWYLTYEYFLKDWGRDRLRDYAQSVATAAGNAAGNAARAANGETLPELSGALVDGVACVHCVGVNNVFPITSTSHPTYGGFQKLLINDGGWITSALLTAGVAVGGGGSLVVSLLHTVAGTSAAAASSAKPSSSTAQNGCGIFEMVFLVSQAQFLTMLGALQLQGAPRFFLELARKLAWSNLQIFPAETSYRPPLLEVTSAVAGASRRLDTTADSASAATGVERYARLVGAEPRHFFYYTCAALAVALAGVLFAYALLRVLLGGCLGKRAAAASLDHRVIWVFLLLLLLAQYIISMASCFQIYATVSDAARNTSDLLLAVVVLAAACVALLAFGIIKIARHRDEIEAHGTPAHDATKWFHLRYSVFYQDYTVENAYFFVAKLVLDVASGAVVGTVQDAPLQIALLVAFNAAFLCALIWRQPFLVPLFYFVAVLAGYLRIALLLLTLVLTKPDIFPQDMRDYVAALIIAINGVLFLCLLVRQFYVLCVAIFRWASRSKQPVGDEEMGIPLQDMRAHNGSQDDEPRKSRASGGLAAPGAFSASRASTKASSGKSSRRAAPETPPISDSALFSSQPYHAMTGDEPRSSRSTKPSSKRRSKADRHSLPGYSSAVSTDDGSTASAPVKGGGRRSLYTRRAKRHRELVGTKNEELPDWAQV